MTNPHETPFQYDDSLVSSCASSSPLARTLSQGEHDANDDGSSGAVHSTPSQSNHQLLRQQQQHIGGGRECRALFDQHASHYQRPPLSEKEEQFWGAIVDDGTLDHNLMDIISPRIEAFLRCVSFVHEHNKLDGKHRVALNRFSDMPSHELPLLSHANENGDASSFGGANFDLEAAVDNLLHAQSKAGYLDLFQRGIESKDAKPTFVPIDDDDAIKKLGVNIRQMQQQRYAMYTSTFQSIRDSWWWIGGGHNHGNEMQDQVDATTTTAGEKPLTRHSSDAKPKVVDKNKVPKVKDELGGLEEKSEDDEESDQWDRYLNWATEDNPDGVPLVHPAMDQGLCGSCWAISALGSLEASIARNMAYIAYEEAFSSLGSSHGHKSDKLDDDHTTFAVLAAQEIERQSISTADLSVQELVDCDTRYDQGCAGGNPLLAFYFLHRFGVTSSKNYPYTGTMDSCKYHKVDQPIATVESWGILTPDHENNMEKVLRYIGPVAVGLIGADPAFLGYEKGVFASSKGGKCDLGQADHAMLITGYGEEVSKDGTVEKYWIGESVFSSVEDQEYSSLESNHLLQTRCRSLSLYYFVQCGEARNSWGEGWGENGYVRVSRVGGKKGHPGVCGIARSPSVALGGMFTKDVKLKQSDKKVGMYGSTHSRQQVDSGDGSRPSDDSTTARASSQIKNIIQ